MDISIIILIVVFILIAVRQIGNVRIQIWQSMTLGAIAVLLTGEMTPKDALSAINIDVMLFLFGMFVVGEALHQSGYLAHISYKFFKRAHSLNSLLFFVLWGFAIASAFLMNDTVAIVGTPVVLLLAKKHEISPKILLLALAFSITIGSVPSAIGNPQNLLIALNGRFANPFAPFVKYLLIPSFINLLIAQGLLRLFYHEDFHDVPLKHSQEPIHDHDLALLSRIAIWLILILISTKIFIIVFKLPYDFRLTDIALVSALPILVGSKKRWKILRHIDWQTLIFFASMFVLMDSVWRSGFFQSILEKNEITLSSPAMIIGVSIVVSQFISNVPLVALLQPLMLHSNVSDAGLMALAAGSTIAGNALILGAASNIIIIQNAEKRAHQTLTLWEFARIGIPLTLMNSFVYWLFMTILE